MSDMERNKAIVKRLIDEAFNSRNLDILPELLSGDFVNHQEVFPLKHEMGPEVFRELYGMMFRAFPDIKIHNHKILADGDMVMIYDTLTGTNTGPLPDGTPSTGKTVKFYAFNILRVVDSKITDRWGLTDNLTMRRQLGLTG